ncbi:agmatinase [Candidatus Aciduliprofundum boonei]|uniref:Agmatinase n=1 Tax=Aciduliprofundum boonei (strain DSM 19572 / T469) TaxID=439481 RepID=D3TB81_ACIB4|nr:agmatinase [Candidatus Aciduliprofundum boonei]ADD07816.1 agmatinase [Aciduliprofundum boonei T469]HII54480.1 agmatinase [Candidatus Aciduliprofundum boonei]
MLLHFADANKNFNESFFIIFGVPFDGTSSYRHGSKFAPDEIRKASYNLESYVMEHKISLSELPIHDMGDIGTLDEFGNVEDVIDTVYSTMQSILPNKFPIMIGGEHSITIGAAKALKKLNAGIIFIDAHGDFRDEYLGNKYSHACTARRAYDILNGKIISIGVRSASQEEVEDAKDLNYEWIDSYEFQRLGWKRTIKKAMEILDVQKVYLSIDIDGIDPAYAPGTGTPEFFGLSPMDVKNIINFLAPNLIGADITEVCPPYDNGNTSILAARLVQEIIAAKWNTMEDKFK